MTAKAFKYKLIVNEFFYLRPEPRPSTATQTMSSAYSDEEQNALRSGDTTPRRALSFPKLSFDRLAQFDEEEDASESEHPAKQRGTPSLAETSEELRRTLSFKTLKEADSASIRKRLWRPSPADNKDRRRPQDLDQLIAFAVASLYSLSSASMAV